MKTLLEARNIKKYFKRSRVAALDGVSFFVQRGRTLGVVGESGAGKSTLAKIALGLLPADSGEVIFLGKDIAQLRPDERRTFRKKVQVIFQEPFLSLDPRMSVEEILKEPFLIFKERNSGPLGEKVSRLLDEVALPEKIRSKMPRQLSGGECQRVAIARAISGDPEMLVCDEPVSSLDAITQPQILNLFLRLQKERGVAYLFITHDPQVARHMSDEMLVLKNGRAVECGPPSSALRFF